jgi:c-di-GMP-related signal transduction protein
VAGFDAQRRRARDLLPAAPAGDLQRAELLAECVENRATLAELREIGVDFAQGYGLARPQPVGG